MNPRLYISFSVELINYDVIMHTCFENYSKFVMCHDRLLSFIELLSSERDTENIISDLYFDEESDCSEENTSDNKDFRSTILQPLQFEPKHEKKERVVIRAIRNYRGSRSQIFLKIGVL